MYKIVSYSVLILCLTFSSCKKIAIDKAHYHYNNDPEGYIETHSKFLNDLWTCPDTSRKNLYFKYGKSLINDTAHFNYRFFGIKNGQCYNHNGSFSIPQIDLNTESLVLSYAEGYGKFHIRKSKVLINKEKKIIYVKILNRLDGGEGSSHSFYIGFIIPKVSDDFEVISESYMTDY